MLLETASFTVIFLYYCLFLVNCADIRIIGKPNVQRPLDGPMIKLANLPSFSQQDPPAADGPPSQNKITFFNQ